MKALFYKILVVFTRIFGLWFFTLISGGIAAGYFVLFPSKVKTGVYFYASVFPEKPRWYHLLCTWRQFLGFTHVFMDRLLLHDFGGVAYTYKGFEHLEYAVDNTGGILLMSHAGNWEVAARLLKKDLPGMNLLLYMGVRDRQQIEGLQKDTVRAAGVKIVGVDEQGGSPFDIVESIRFLKSKGLVSMTGDMVWRKQQKTVWVDFLGHRVNLPEAPFVLSLVSGAPIIVFFAFRILDRNYHFTASKPIFVKPATRDQRPKAIQAAAQAYADHLENAVRQHPAQWYHFEPFLNKKQALSTSSKKSRTLS